MIQMFTEAMSKRVCLKRSMFPSNFSCAAASGLGVRIMVFDGTFNNISVISWQSVLLVEETGVPGENHGPADSH
jgi:hypothetical protein